MRHWSKTGAQRTSGPGMQMQTTRAHCGREGAAHHQEGSPVRSEPRRVWGRVPVLNDGLVFNSHLLSSLAVGRFPLPPQN